MKVPNLRILAVPVVALALTAGVTATAAAANAATTQGTHVSAAAPAAPAAKAAGAITSTVTGTFTNAAGLGTFAGTFTPKKFAVVNGVLDATGVLKGTLTSADGTSLGAVTKTITTTVDTSKATANAPAAVACNVLNLTLGPLNLNLLGLVVTLNQIHLVITAVPGAGNLLGNLLCAVAGLLNGGGLGGLSGLLGQISLLLNGILALL
jgi:hypothetical protein